MTPAHHIAELKLRSTVHVPTVMLVGIVIDIFLIEASIVIVVFIVDLLVPLIARVVIISGFVACPLRLRLVVIFASASLRMMRFIAHVVLLAVVGAVLFALL